MSASLISTRLVRNLNIVRPTGLSALRCRFSSHMTADADVMEKEKQKSLRGETIEAIPEHPGWNEKLASRAEASIKADHAPEKPVESLQKESVEHIKKQYQ